MVRIGYTRKQKQTVVDDYIRSNPEINHVYVFTRLLNPTEQEKPQEHLRTSECYLEFPAGLKVEYINWSEIIMYRTYWPLLSNIDKNSLIIVDELMKLGFEKRSDLTYNCLHHYLAPTTHRIIFEFTPVIDNENDIMIAFAMDDIRFKAKNKFSVAYLDYIDFDCIPRPLPMEITEVSVTSKQEQDYINKIESLFDNLGSKEPITIANEAQIIAGNYKKGCIEDDKKYLARNARFKMNNVFSLSKFNKMVTDNEDWYFIDVPLSRLAVTDAVKLARQDKINFISTGLSIDRYVIEEHNRIEDLKGRFYETVKASL